MPTRKTGGVRPENTPRSRTVPAPRHRHGPIGWPRAKRDRRALVPNTDRRVVKSMRPRSGIRPPSSPARKASRARGRTEADGTETPATSERSSSVHHEQSVPAADHDSLADAAGMPRSDRDKAVDLLIDFHQASAEHVPESQRLHNLPDDVLQAGLFDSDAHKSMVATMEIIRRGTTVRRCRREWCCGSSRRKLCTR